MRKWIHEVEALPISELMEYVAMSNIEPWGEERDDIRHANIAAIDYNCHRPRRSRAMRIQDFMVDWYAPKQQTGDQIWSTLVAFANDHNASLKR